MREVHERRRCVMSESERLRLLSLVVRLLNQSGSWTGRTHIQKLVYFAQQLLGIAPEYEFVLYQRGPYCFQLDSDVRPARAAGPASHHAPAMMATAAPRPAMPWTASLRARCAQSGGRPTVAVEGI